MKSEMIVAHLNNLNERQVKAITGRDQNLSMRKERMKNYVLNDVLKVLESVQTSRMDTFKKVISSLQSTFTAVRECTMKKSVSSYEPAKNKIESQRIFKRKQLKVKNSNQKKRIICNPYPFTDIGNCFITFNLQPKF